MISLEYAERLKELGIDRKDLDAGDGYIDQGGNLRICGDYGEAEYGGNYNHKNCAWLPTLSQLLEEVVKRGYELSLLGTRYGYQFGLAADRGTFSDWWPENGGYTKGPEDAVALALIAIKEGKDEKR